MNNQNQLHERLGCATYPKRKRGRPRKYAKPDEENQNNLQITTYQHPNEIPNNASTDGSVGQTVHGFIDGSFEAGYLLTVKVENSEIILKGAVFKPGKYVPLSAENDILPNVPMIHRSEIPFPSKMSFTPHRNDPPRVEQTGTSNVEPQGQCQTQPILSETPNKDAVIHTKTEVIISKPNEAPVIPIKLEIIDSGGPTEEAPVQIQTKTISFNVPTQHAAIQFQTETVPSETSNEGPTIQFLTKTMASKRPIEGSTVQFQTETMASPRESAAIQSHTEAISSEGPIKGAPIQFQTGSIASERPNEGASIQFHAETIASGRPNEGASIQFQTETMPSKGTNEDSSLHFNSETMISERPKEDSDTQFRTEPKAIEGPSEDEASNVKGEKSVEAENAVPIETMDTEKVDEVSRDDIAERQEGFSDDHFAG